MSYRGHNYNNNNNHHHPQAINRSSSTLDVINSFIPSSNPIIKKFESFTDKFDNIFDNLSLINFLKPFIPTIGRFLIVATFIEDSFRIMSQWREQVYYLSTFRHLYEWIVKIFLILNIIGMLAGSTLIILRKLPIPSSITLSSIVLLQGLLYGLFFDAPFLLRNISVIGGLLLALSDSLIIDKRSLSMPGLPMIESNDYNKKYFLLIGRIMLIVLFITFTITLHFTFLNLLLILIGFLSCFSIVIGYKTKFFASILILLLTIHNCLTNHYWSYSYKDSRRDYLRYEFFQTLSIVGGLLLIANTGAGELSIDEKKKKF